MWTTVVLLKNFQHGLETVHSTDDSISEGDITDLAHLYRWSVPNFPYERALVIKPGVKMESSFSASS